MLAKVSFLQIQAASTPSHDLSCRDSKPGTWITESPSRGRTDEIPRVETKKFTWVFQVPRKAGDVRWLGAAVVQCGVDHQPALSSHKWAQD